MGEDRRLVFILLSTLDVDGCMRHKVITGLIMIDNCGFGN